MPSVYERQAEYWTEDLSDRGFETAVQTALRDLAWEFQDNTTSHDEPDLYLFRQVRGRRVRAALELKEKRQPYRGRWADLAGFPEPELLVVDEVAVRKLLAWATRAFLLFCDATQGAAPYVLYSIIDLFCAPKVRVQRPISLNEPRLKAKWLLDRRHGVRCPRLHGAFAAIANYLDHGMGDDLRRVEAHGSFVGERIETV